MSSPYFDISYHLNFEDSRRFLLALENDLAQFIQTAKEYAIGSPEETRCAVIVPALKPRFSPLLTETTERFGLRCEPHGWDDDRYHVVPYRTVAHIPLPLYSDFIVNTATDTISEIDHAAQPNNLVPVSSTHERSTSIDKPNPSTRGCCEETVAAKHASTPPDDNPTVATGDCSGTVDDSTTSDMSPHVYGRPEELCLHCTMIYFFSSDYSQFLHKPVQNSSYRKSYEVLQSPSNLLGTMRGGWTLEKTPTVATFKIEAGTPLLATLSPRDTPSEDTSAGQIFLTVAWVPRPDKGWCVRALLNDDLRKRTLVFEPTSTNDETCSNKHIFVTTVADPPSLCFEVPFKGDIAAFWMYQGPSNNDNGWSVIVGVNSFPLDDIFHLTFDKTVFTSLPNGFKQLYFSTTDRVPHTSGRHDHKSYTVRDIKILGRGCALDSWASTDHIVFLIWDPERVRQDAAGDCEEAHIPKQWEIDEFVKWLTALASVKVVRFSTESKQLFIICESSLGADVVRTDLKALCGKTATGDTLSSSDRFDLHRILVCPYKVAARLCSTNNRPRVTGRGKRMISALVKANQLSNCK